MIHGSKPIDLKITTLGLVLTVGCALSCRHCYLSCSPRKLQYSMTWKEAADNVYDAARAGIRHLFVTGGEIFVFPRIVYSLAQYAHSCGMTVSLRTSGFWATTQAIADKAVGLLKATGVGSLGLSAGKYHNEFVPVERVRRVLRSCEAFDMRVWTDTVGRQDIFDLLGEYYCRSLRSSGNAPEPVGRAETLGFEYGYGYPAKTFEKQGERSFSCSDWHTLEVLPHGFVRFSPKCCMHPFFFQKKPAGKDWILQLVERFNEDACVRFLWNYGVGGIIRVVDAIGGIGSESTYLTACEVCAEHIVGLYPDAAPPPEVEKMWEDIGSAPRRHTDKMAKNIAEKIDRLSDIAVSKVPVVGGEWVPSKEVMKR